jgi:hypothetical protein
MLGAVMKYMQDLPQPQTYDELVGWVATPQPCEDHEKWVLVDGAVLGKKLTKSLFAFVRREGVVSVLADTEFSSYGEFAPHLIRLSHAYSAHKLLRFLVEDGAGCPAISVLDAFSDKAALVSVLRWLARASTEDGVEMYCRFADTRITSTLFKFLCTHQNSELVPYIGRWQVIDRYGALQTVFSNKSISADSRTCYAQTDHSSKQLIFSDRQFASIMNACEADEIFYLLSEGATELVPEANFGQFHDRLANLVISARRYGLESTAEIFRFCVVALATRDTFFLDPIISSLWTQIRERKVSFSDSVESWPDETWTALSSTGSISHV